MPKKIAGIISKILVPPSFTILVFTFLPFKLESEQLKIITIIFTSFFFGFLFPIIFFFYLRRSGRLSDHEALIKEERTLPFAAAVIFYIAGFIVLFYTEAHIILIALWFCYISNTILILVINRFWKISAHMMGAAGHAAALLLVQSVWFWAAVAAIPILAWARMYLKCHDISQISAGILLGFFSTYLQMVFIIKYFYA